jgi:hypothetical protein
MNIMLSISTVVKWSLQVPDTQAVLRKPAIAASLHPLQLCYLLQFAVALTAEIGSHSSVLLS